MGDVLLQTRAHIEAVTDQPPPETQQDDAPQRSRPRWPIYAAAGAVLALLAAGTVVFLLARDGSFTVTGSITVVDSDGNGITVESDRCRGKGGFTDLTKATQVVITDAAGTVVATGAIDDFGTPTNVAGRFVECELPFTVDGVPAGHDFYGIEVARRGRLIYPAEQLRKPLPLQVGR